MDRPHLEPSAEHPLTVEPAEGTVHVTVAGHSLGSSANALVLREASYPPIYYVPEADLDATAFEPSATSTYCPFKGDASYVDAVVDGQRVSDVAWTYRSPYPAVADIADHLAFYPDKAEVTTS